MKSLFPRLETPHFDLRPVSTRDLEEMLSWAEDPEVARYLPWGKVQERLLALETLYRNYVCMEGVYALELREEHRCVGILTVKLISEQDAAVGYALNKCYWGKGLMKEVLTVMIEHLFADLEIWEVQAECAQENLPSIHLLEACGLKLIGNIKDKGICCFRYAMIRKVPACLSAASAFDSPNYDYPA
ncbi:MAG: GNAT family N-acetyltransferase [Spirochaetia bacterium]|nr:GNAT family N-acetyltransferase [Spirochaetia bacterium]